MPEGCPKGKYGNNFHEDKTACKELLAWLAPEAERLAAVWANASDKMTLTGSKANPEYMGVYERSGKAAHGAPVFVKTAGDTTNYLFRYNNGKWIHTLVEEYLAEGLGTIQSSKAADLPSEAGLTWTSFNATAWQDDPAMTCTAVRGMHHEHSHTLLPTPVPTVFNPPVSPGKTLDVLTLPCLPTHPPLTQPNSRRARKRLRRGSPNKRQRRRG